MAVITVAQFAAELNRPATALLEQLQSAGVTKGSSDDALTEADKERLLDYLRTAHGTGSSERKKITLTKKSTSEIKQADASGKARTIQVEVRKKRTFVKRDETPMASDEEELKAPVVDDAELQKREEEARRQAELLRRQEEDLAEKRRLREAQEATDRAAAEARQRAAAEEATAALVAAAAAPAPAPSGKAVAAPAPAPAPAEPPKPAVRVVRAASDAGGARLGRRDHEGQSGVKGGPE